MATPSIRSTGTAVTGGAATLAVPYPATIVADDVLVIAAGHRSTTTIPTPSGWQLLRSRGHNGNAGVWLFGKRATGSESGSVTLSMSTQPQFAVMVSIRDVPTALGDAYFEAGADTAALNNAIFCPTIACGGVERLAIFTGYVSFNDTNISGFSATGESGGDWTRVAGLNSAAGNDGSWTVQQASMAGGGTVSGGDVGNAASSSRGSVATGVAIIGATPAPPAVGRSFAVMVG